MKKRLKEVLWGSVSSLVSAIIISVFFAIWNDNQGYNLTGIWSAKKHIQETSVKREKELIVGYDIFLTEFKQKMIMNAEKRYEIFDGNKTTYSGKDRTRLKCKGEKVFNFFSANHIVFNCIEKGIRRDTITILDLTVKSENELFGTFSSSAADEKGMIYLFKEIF
jgi:hypothetical protein